MCVCKGKDKSSARSHRRCLDPLFASLLLCYRMATTASSAANSASRYSIDSSMSRSRHDPSPWMAADSDAIHDDPAQDDPFTTPWVENYENADKKPVWNKPSNSSAEVGPVMGAESWPALSLSARASSNKSPSLESSKSLSDGSSSSSSMPPPQVLFFFRIPLPIII